MLFSISSLAIIPIVILLIPGVVVCLIFELIIWILVVVMTIYELGNKKE